MSNDKPKVLIEIPKGTYDDKLIINDPLRVVRKDDLGIISIVVEQLDSLHTDAMGETHWSITQNPKIASRLHHLVIRYLLLKLASVTNAAIEAEITEALTPSGLKLEDLTGTVRSENPWTAGCWDAKWFNLNQTPAAPVPLDDIEALLWADDTGDAWDGEYGAIFLTKDGRYIAWESSWGPTGSGFNQDAYGGDAVVYVGQPSELPALINLVISDTFRDKARVALQDRL